MWKEKLGDYLIDISKYMLTGVFVASMLKDFADLKWVVYIGSAAATAVALALGLLLTNDSKKKDKED